MNLKAAGVVSLLWLTVGAPATTPTPLSSWLHVSGQALSLLHGRTPPEARPPSSGLEAPLVAVLGAQPRLLALLMLGLVYATLAPVALATALSFRLNSAQPTTASRGVAWNAYCLGLAALVSTGLGTLVCLEASRRAMDEAAVPSTQLWHEALDWLEAFVNRTGHRLGEEVVLPPYPTVPRQVLSNLNSGSDCAANPLVRRCRPQQDSPAPPRERLDALLLRRRRLLEDTQLSLSGLRKAKQRVVDAAGGGGLLEALARTALGLTGPALALDAFLLLVLALGSLVGLLSHRSSVLPRERGIASHAAGVLLSADALLMALFCASVTPPLLALLALGAGAQCYVCEPFQQNRWSALDVLAESLWPTAQRGDTFRPLSPSLLAARCGPEGEDDRAIMAALRSGFPRPAVKPPAQSPLGSPTAEQPETTSSGTLQLNGEPGPPRNSSGSCASTLRAFRSALSHHCDAWLPALAGVWLALSLDLVRYTVAMAVCLGASGHLVRARGLPQPVEPAPPKPRGSETSSKLPQGRSHCRALLWQRPPPMNTLGLAQMPVKVKPVLT